MTRLPRDQFMTIGALVSGALMTLGVGLLALLATGGIGGGDTARGAAAPTTAPLKISTQAAALATINAAPAAPAGIALASADRGAALFTTFQPEAGFACATCHHPDSEQQLIGPGLLNVRARAETRVEGQSAQDYLFTSIVNPTAYVVEGFPANLMPQIWGEIYTEQQIYDLVAYLMTLEGAAEAVAADEDAGAADEAVAVSDADLSGGDAQRGAELFDTFQPDAGFACMTCHLRDTENRLIGPGLLNVRARAETRVEGLTAQQYLYQSIINPDAYVVDSFSADLMPENWAEIYDDTDIRDLIAYLLTLQ